MNNKLTNLTWLIRREFWEHKSFFMAPLILMAITTLTSLVAAVRGAEHVSLFRDALDAHGEFDTDKLSILVEVVFAGLGSFFAFTMSVVAFFYLLDSLYSERRDRSVLFWKSIPITDRTTVLSKFITGVVALPLIAVVATVATYIIVMLIVSVILGTASGFPLATVWNPLTIIGTTAKTMSLTFMFALYFLPISAWLLFCSAFAKKAPILFALFIPGGIILAEHWALSKSYLATAIGNYFERFAMNISERDIEFDMDGFDFNTGQGDFNAEGGLPGIGDFANLFTEPMTYAGLAVAAVFIYLSIWWRRNRIDYG